MDIQQTATRDIKIQSWVNFLSGVLFLTPVVTLLYAKTGLGLFEITLIANASTMTMWLLELPTSALADVAGRRFSLLLSVLSNLCAALFLLVYPTMWGFLLSAFFAALYWSFWSGTGQAFLEENLRVLGKEKTFGKVISGFMMSEKMAGILTPLVASAVLFYIPAYGFTVLAALDVVAAIILVILTLLLRDIPSSSQDTQEEVSHVQRYFATMKDAVTSVFSNPDIRLLVLLRCFGNHVSYLPLILLPTLVLAGMPESAGGIIATLETVVMMGVFFLVSKLSEQRSYVGQWALAIAVQSLILIVASFFLHNWLLLAGISILFMGFEALWQPAWNHVLVQVVHGKAIATTRSVVFALFALYSTVGKQISAMIPLQFALWSIAAVMIIALILCVPSLRKIERQLS